MGSGRMNLDRKRRFIFRRSRFASARFRWRVRAGVFVLAFLRPRAGGLRCRRRSAFARLLV